jgi:hypothetical protein
VKKITPSTKTLLVPESLLGKIKDFYLDHKEKSPHPSIVFFAKLEHFTISVYEAKAEKCKVLYQGFEFDEDAALWLKNNQPIKPVATHYGSDEVGTGDFNHRFGTGGEAGGGKRCGRQFVREIRHIDGGLHEQAALAVGAESDRVHDGAGGRGRRDDGQAPGVFIEATDGGEDAIESNAGGGRQAGTGDEQLISIASGDGFDLRGGAFDDAETVGENV